MSYKFYFSILFFILLACSKDDKPIRTVGQQPIVQEETPTTPVEELPSVIENVSETDLILVDIQIPPSTLATDYMLIDDKGRIVPINTTAKAQIEQNTMVSLVSEVNGKVAYFGYFPEVLKESSTSTGKGSKIDVCDFSNVLGVQSTAELLIAVSQTKYANMFFGSTNRNQLFDIYNSNMPCTQFSEQEINDISVVIQEAVDAGLSITSEAVFAKIKTAMSTVTGGIFTDCVDLVRRGFEEKTMALISFPQDDLNTSLILYKEEDVNQPNVAFPEFNNQQAVGVIIDTATPLNDADGNWKFNLKVYNSLPIPFGVGVGKLIEGNSVLTQPISDIPEHFIGSNPSSMISIVKNGISCEGFIKNMHDNYYAVTGDGTEIRANKFEISEIELIMNPANDHVVFLGSNESTYVKSWHLLEAMSVLVDYLAGFGENKLSNQNNFSEVKYGVYKELTNILVSSAEFKNFISTASFDIEEAKNLIVKITTEYVGNLAESNTSSIINQVRKQNDLGKLDKESAFVFWLNLGTELIEKGIYFEAWTKLNELNSQALDYRFYIPPVPQPIAEYPHNPIPVNEATNIPVNGFLTFDKGTLTDSTTSYHLFLGKSLNNIPVIDYGIEQNSFAYTNLESNTTYYWYIETRVNDLLVNTTSTWSFTTDGEETTMVDGAYNPIPLDNSIDWSTDFELKFTPGDNSPNDVTYKLFLDTVPNPQVSYDLGNQTTYNYTNLLENTIYYWKVETLSSNEEILATSETWSFTTTGNSEENIYEGDLTLTTQEEIDNFNYTEIKGRLTIGAGGVVQPEDQITNLLGLRSLVKVEVLWLDHLLIINSLEGLENLRSAPKIRFFVVRKISSLEPLENVEDLDILDLDGLEGLIDLNTIPTFNLTTLILNDVLDMTSLNGIEKLTNLSEIHIFYCPILTDFCALGNFITSGQIKEENYKTSVNDDNIPSYQDMLNGNCRD